MRIALLAAVKRTDTGELRAEQMLAGRSVLAWQVELARELACERVLCLCEAPRDEILALQQEFERSGGEFHVIRSNVQLASLVRADDELVVLLDGLLVDREAILRAILPNAALEKAILTMPADHALAEAHPDDFERIDRDHRWAGIATMRASKVHQLADLPPDGDAMSLLLRLALQSRVECRPTLTDWLEDNRWFVVTDTKALATREGAIVSDSVPRAGWSNPTKFLAARIVGRIAPQLIEKAGEIKAGTALALLLGAVVLAAYGYGPVALAMAAIAAFCAQMADIWLTLRERLWRSGRGSRLARAVHLATGIGSCAVLILANGPILPIEPASVALPLLVLGLASLVAQSSEGAAVGFFSDTAIHLVIFAFAAAFGQLESALAIFAVIALAQLLLRPRVS